MQLLVMIFTIFFGVVFWLVYYVVSKKNEYTDNVKRKTIDNTSKIIVDNYTNMEKEGDILKWLRDDGNSDDIVDKVMDSYNRVFSSENAPNLSINRRSILFDETVDNSRYSWEEWMKKLFLSFCGLVPYDVATPTMTSYGVVSLYDKNFRLVSVVEQADCMAGGFMGKTTTCFPLMYWINEELKAHSAPEIVFHEKDGVYYTLKELKRELDSGRRIINGEYVLSYEAKISGKPIVGELDEQRVQPNHKK